MSAGEQFERLVEIMHELRHSCPWDREQTHQSLRPCLLEEAYEVIHALDEGSPDALCEELGDLAMQIVFHAEIADEDDCFDIEDVLRAIGDKLVRRHPHVFADAQAQTPAAVVRNWESIKRSEKEGRSALAGLPEELPALLKATRMLTKMRNAGLDPFAPRDALVEAQAGLGEFQRAAAAGDAAGVERALGTICLALAGVAESMQVNPEDALRTALGRMASAFRREETEMREARSSFADLSVADRRAAAERLLAESEEG